MQKFESGFLARDARLGAWWVPDDADLNDEGDFDSLPQRRESGVLATDADSGWSLLLASRLPFADGSSPGFFYDGVSRHDVMWGKVPGSAISLFDAARTDHSTDLSSHLHCVWRGSWYVDSPTTWVDLSTSVEGVYIEFAAAGPWSEKTPGEGRRIDLLGQWDEGFNTFTRPEPLSYEATVGGASLSLHRKLVGDTTADRLDLRLSTYLLVSDDMRLDQIQGEWVEPLHNLVGFFWLKNPGVVSVRVKLRNSDPLSSVCFSGKLAPIAPHDAAVTSDTIAPFATVEGIADRGFSFQDFLSGYWLFRKRGYGTAIDLLNESQYSHLDHSLEARLLNAVKSLEAFERTRSGHQQGTVNITEAARRVLDTSGQTGARVRTIWDTRQLQPRPFENSIARIRHTYLAHGQSGTRRPRFTESELSDHHWHLVALQWLLRRTYLETMGIKGTDADKLVSEAWDYKKTIGAMQDHYGG